MTTKTKPQIRFDDRIIENPALLELLEERQTLKESASLYQKKDKETKAKISSMKEEMPFRIGRFVISKQNVPAKSVAFKTEDKEKFTIKTIEGE